MELLFFSLYTRDQRNELDYLSIFVDDLPKLTSLASNERDTTEEEEHELPKRAVIDRPNPQKEK